MTPFDSSIPLDFTTWLLLTRGQGQGAFLELIELKSGRRYQSRPRYSVRKDSDAHIARGICSYPAVAAVSLHRPPLGGGRHARSWGVHLSSRRIFLCGPLPGSTGDSRCDPRGDHGPNGRRDAHFLARPADGRRRIQKLVGAGTDVCIDFARIVLPGQTVRARAEKMFWRGNKLKSKVELTLADGTPVAQGTIGGVVIGQADAV